MLSSLLKKIREQTKKQIFQEMQNIVYDVSVFVVL